MKNDRKSNRPDTYQLVTDRIIEALDRGVVPWRKPWRGAADAPRNLASKKPYRGINAFLLSLMPYPAPWWLTYRQAQQRGGTVRKGEKATPVIFWQWLERQERDPKTGEPAKHRIPLARCYHVFNVAQCDRIEAPAPEQTDGPPVEPIAACEAIIAGMPQRPEIKHGSGQAFYSPGSDSVAMPDRDRFTDAAAYYGTLFHELGHSTGHSSRLDRESLRSVVHFGDHAYSKEELVAEFTAAFLCGESGIEAATLDNSASYIAHWVAKLRDERKLAVQAAAAAQHAADFILGRRDAGDALAP